MKLLVVEDEAAIADFLERGLAAEGYEVSVAGDGVEGERLALADGFDLVVSICACFRGATGSRCSARSAPPSRRCRVIWLTAKAEVADRVEGLDSGATDYMTKPFAFPELLARVRAACASRRAKRPPCSRRPACGSTSSLSGSSATAARCGCPSARPSCSPT